MAQFDSHKWTREFKEAKVDQANLDEVDYSTKRLTSNIDQKWKDKGDMENDLLAWYQTALAAGGEDLAHDLLGVMKEVVFQMEKTLKSRIQRQKKGNMSGGIDFDDIPPSRRASFGFDIEE